MFDIVVQNGFIVDGTGNPWFKGNIGISGGKISKVENLREAQAKRIIDAHGLAVSPGFIDMHSHGDFSILRFPKRIA